MVQNKDKTNVLRILDRYKINYTVHHFDDSIAISAIEVAKRLNQNPNKVFKTLVTVGKSNINYVFVIPGNKELNLKKAAKCVEEKSIEMIKSKDLLLLTGYVHGGCSPIGMKKMFKTIFHDTAKDFDTILFSAGKIGCQVEMNILDLNKVITFDYANLVEDEMND